MIKVAMKVVPELEPEFVPAVLWNREYQRLAAASGKSVEIALALYRPNGSVSVRKTRILPHTAENRALNLRYIERMVKFLLWMKGGYRVAVCGCDELAADLKKIYSPSGERGFDYEMMGERIYGRPFETVALAQAPEEHETGMKLGGHNDGCRIGFDLGGSDRKCAAVIDGKVVHTEEVVWDPYFQKDPEYHRQGILDSLRRAAEKLPRVDAIGGSAAGVYVDNQPRLSSLFRGVESSEFARSVVPMFNEIAREYGVPFVVANDGEVTALAGAISMNASGVIGISMGTSVAGGYVKPDGCITDWLNELAFVPVDYRDDAPADEWSGDCGCAVQYFCQQGAARLCKRSGIEFDAAVKLPERLVKLQELMKSGDERAEKVYRTIGVEFGYTVAHFADFYEISKLLILGRVSSGKGGEVIIDCARRVLETEFPELAERIEFRVPDETFKRHGQAVVAATLPEIK